MRPHRGNALLPALIIVLVLSAVAAASLALAQYSRRDAVREARNLTQAACIDAARQAVLGRLRVFGLEPTAILLDQAVTVESGQRKLQTGHLGGPAVTSIAAIPPNLVGGSGARNRDISNLIVPSPVLGGRHYRVVVKCSDPAAGEMELEFTFKYGL